MKRRKTIDFNFSRKHIEYIRACKDNTYNIAEGAVRAGKTVDNVKAFAYELKDHPDKIFLATGSTGAIAKLNIGDCNGFGLEHIFHNQCHWGKYKGNEALIISGPDTHYEQKIVIFCGGGKADSFKSFRGSSPAMWIATEINLHHDNTIKEAFNRTLASHRRKFFWDLNPDHPNSPIYTEYIDKYVERAAKGEMLGGVNYKQFTIFDNINISEESRKEFISQYEPGTIWYNRDILGQRCIAEGLIYPKMAAEFSLPAGQIKPHSITAQQARSMEIVKVIIGVDFGGNGSGHAFVATGLTRNYEKMIALRSRRYLEGGNDEDTGMRIADVGPNEFNQFFLRFVRDVQRIFGFVTVVYADSEEQVLIRGMRNALAEAGINLRVEDALKTYINDRIFALTAMYAQERFYYVEPDCRSLMGAIGTAIWDPQQPTQNIRLDNGTSDIDSMDAFEYTFERDIERMIKRKTHR